MLTEIQSIIVEDEIKAKEALEDLISMVSSSVKVVGSASSVEEAIALINKLKPQLVFLDIQLGNESSFEILRQLVDVPLKVIFITAYSDYAVEAFKFSAVDYLLKPVNPEHLSHAIDKVKRELEQRKPTLNMNALFDNLKSLNKPKKIVLSTLDYVHVVDIQHIVKCQSSINYTVFHLQDGKEIVVSKTLKEFDEQLSPYGFFRTHKSWLINLSFVSGYNRKEGGTAVMEDGSEIPVSISRKEEFMEVLKGFFR